MSTTSISVRTARRDDAFGIAAVHDASWRSAYRGIIPGLELEKMVERRGPVWWDRAVRQKACVLVLERGGEIAGYATTGRNRSRRIQAAGEVYELYLKPDHQGVGLGRRLFESALGALAASGNRSILTWVLEDNEPAIGFYETLGGRIAGRGVERFGVKDLAKRAYRWSL